MKNKTFTAIATAEIKPTPNEIAEAFWCLDAEQQAEFFDRLAKISGANLCRQLAYVSDHLTPDAKLAMRTIGDYAE